MPFYEVIYETGAHSVLSAENDEALHEGLSEQHRRAMHGERGQLASSSTPHPDTGQHDPATHPAERVKRVLVYENHPGDFVSDDPTKLARIAPENKNAHESNYHAPESREMDLNFLSEVQ